MRPCQPSSVNQLERTIHQLYFFRRKSVSLHVYFVYRANLRRRTVRHKERRQILYQLGTCTQHRIRPNSAELVRSAPPADYRVVLYNDVPAECGVRTHYNVVAHNAVVRYMAVCQNVVVVAYNRERLVGCRAVRRGVFPENVVVADSQTRVAALEL